MWEGTKSGESGGGSDLNSGRGWEGGGRTPAFWACWLRFAAARSDAPAGPAAHHAGNAGAGGPARCDRFC